jgi:hypothetical protein
LRSSSTRNYFKGTPIKNEERKQQETRGEMSENSEKIEKYESEISDLFLFGTFLNIQNFSL